MKAIFLLLFPLALSAAPLRVVTFNIETGRLTGGSIDEGLNDPGTDDYESVKAILARINADVVCLQEITNKDVSGGTQGNTNSDVHTLAGELGLDHVYIPSTAIDFELRNVILSRYPFLDADGIGTAAYMDEIGVLGADGQRAKDVTRAYPAVVVDVPGAEKPATIITVHNKASTDDASKFRRAVELARLADYLDRNGLDETDNILVLGDFNLSGTNETFSNEPADLPSSFNRGVDIPLPVTYSTDPDFYFPTPWQLVALDPRAINGSDDTFISTAGNGSTLDYLLPSPAITVTGTEIYRSDLDVSNSTGLPKTGNPLPSQTSFDASDHFAVFADLELADLVAAPTSYVLTASTPTVSEAFTSFDGQSDPVRWTGVDTNWSGLFPGTATPGSYAFGVGTSRSPGVVLGTGPVAFQTLIENQTGGTLTALQISFDARQWLATNPGSSDRFTASLTTPAGGTISLPGLTWVSNPSATVPTGQTLTDVAANLALAPGESATFTITASRGPENGGVSSEVFLNELHYDNDSTDVGEFVEIVVSPGYTGSLSDIEVLFYNGTGGAVYDSHALSTFDNFANPTNSGGYLIFSKAVAGIQNGPAEGIAIVVGGSVTSFVSYEGTVTATGGPAVGMTSIELPQSQSSTPPEDFGAIGFTGAGGESGDFSWVRFGDEVAHTPGQPNPGQSFTGPAPLPPQAMAFDNFVVSIAVATDTDGDGIPDETDGDDDGDGLADDIEIALGTNPLLADSDNDGTPDADEDADGDGQTNGAEANITLTDPGDANSLFRVTILPNPPGLPILSFQTLTGRNYQVLASDNLQQFSGVASYSGDGNVRLHSLAGGGTRSFYRVRVTLAD